MLTLDERKERYYKLVLEKSHEIYFSWSKDGTTSKQLVTQANEYAFDKRLKTDYLRSEEHTSELQSL